MRDKYLQGVKENILSTTESLLQKNGADNLTIRDLAKALNCSVGSIYTYFPDKAALFKEIYRRACVDFLDMLKKVPQKPSKEEENYIQLIILACEFRIKNSYRYRDLYTYLNGETPNELKKIQIYLMEKLANLKLPALLDQNSLKMADRAILSICEGLASMNKKGNPQPDEMVAFTIRSLLISWKTKENK